MKSEPILTTQSIGAIVAAVLALLVQAGLPLEPGLVESILTLVAVVVPVILAALYGRSEVQPVSTDRRGPGESNIR